MTNDFDGEFDDNDDVDFPKVMDNFSVKTQHDSDSCGIYACYNFFAWAVMVSGKKERMVC